MKTFFLQWMHLIIDPVEWPNYWLVSNCPGNWDNFLAGKCMLLVSVDKYPSKKVIVSSDLSACMSQQKMSWKKTIMVLVIYLMLTLAGYFSKPEVSQAATPPAKWITHGYLANQIYWIANCEPTDQPAQNILLPIQFCSILGWQVKRPRNVAVNLFFTLHPQCKLLLPWVQRPFETVFQSPREGEREEKG